MKIKANSVVLTQEQITFYNDHGYLVVPNVYDVEMCNHIKDVAKELADSDYSVCLNVHRESNLFFQIMKDPTLVAIVETIQDHKVVGLNDQYLFKKAGSKYAKQAWEPHQDNAYVKSEHGAYTQLHVFLDDSDKENGGLYYYSGSHFEGILPNSYTKSWKEPIGDDGISRPGRVCEVSEKYSRRDIVASMGSICLQHGEIIHGSYPNLSDDRDRQQYSVAYLNKGASYNSGYNSRKIPIPLD